MDGRSIKQPQSGWYVVQVLTGSEQKVCDAIVRECEKFDDEAPSPEAQVGLIECFSPRFDTRKKWKGEWLDVERPLLPGYLIADVRNPAALARVLIGMSDFGRLLTADETYSPLDDRERSWIESQTSIDDRVVPMSFGYKEGEKLVISDGPLQGKEVMVKSFDRKNCLAHIEFHVGPMTFKATVGLAIMPSGKVRMLSR